jgi:Zn-dependent membrane protease YugP
MTALIVIGLIFIFAFSMWAQFRVKSAFNQYRQIAATSGVTGAEAAASILRAAGIQDVRIEETNSFLGDHYDPSNKVLCLSSDVYHTPSVAALGIAAHECGHAIQHKVGYAPLKARAAVVPLAVVAGNVLPWLMIFGGFVFSSGGGMFAIQLGFWCYLILTIFQLITLPVEYDASRRAKIILDQMGMIQPGGEAAGVNKVLNSAALTYVAAFVASLLWLLHFATMMLGNDRD